MIPGGPPKAKPKKKPKAKAKPKYTPPPSRSDAAQGTGAKPVKPRTSPNPRYTPKSVVGDTSRPADPVAVPRVRNGKVIRDSSGKPSVRTFRNTDDYKAYQARKRIKAKVRRQTRHAIIRELERPRTKLTAKGRSFVHEQDVITRIELENKKDAHPEIPENKRKDERYLRARHRSHKSGAIAIERDRGDEPGGHYAGLTKPVKRKARRKIRRETHLRMKLAEPAIDKIGTRIQKVHDEEISQGLPPSGTSAEKGVARGARKRAQAEKDKALKAAKLKRRKGGLGRWATNIKDEAVDTLTSIPASAVQVAKAGTDTALSAGEYAAGKSKRERKHGREAPKLASELKQGFLDSSVLVPLVKGDVKEALGRLKERPLSGVGEVVAGAGAGLKVARGASIVARASKASEGGSLADKIDTAKAASHQRRVKRAPLQAGPLTRTRTHSKVAGIRIAAKASDKAKSLARRDPNLAGHRRTRRILKKDADRTVRNVQHGGQFREEVEAHGPVRAAHKEAGVHPTRKSHRTKRAGLELMVRNGDLRTGTLTEVKATMAKIRRNIGEHGGDVKAIDKLIDDLNENRHSAFLMDSHARRGADKLAQISRRSDEASSQREYAEGGRLAHVAAVQGLVERGDVRALEPGEKTPPAKVKAERGEPTPPPASASSPRPRADGDPGSQSKPKVSDPDDRLTEGAADLVRIRRRTQEATKAGKGETVADHMKTYRARRDKLIERYGKDAVEAEVARILPTGGRASQIPARATARPVVSHTEGRGRTQTTVSKTTPDPDAVKRGELDKRKQAYAKTQQKHRAAKALTGADAYLKAVQARVVAEKTVTRLRETLRDDNASDRLRTAASNQLDDATRELDAAYTAEEQAAKHPHVTTMQLAERAEKAAERAVDEAPRPQTNRALDVSDVFVPEAKQLGKNEIARAKGAVRDKAIASGDPSGVIDPADSGAKVSKQQAERDAPLTVDQIESENADNNRPTYVWVGGAKDGQVVRRADAEAANPGGAFLRGRPLDVDPKDRRLGAPTAGHGYHLDDLLDRRGDRALPSELEKQQRGTLARMTQSIVERYTLDKANGKGKAIFGVREAAQREANIHKHADAAVLEFKDARGVQFAVVPKVIAQRIDKQLKPIGHVEALGRWGTRTAIRATLPLSIAWHAGNVVDLATRLALTVPPRMWATQGADLARHLEQHLEALSPDLRAEILATLKGHMGSRQTLRNPRASDTLYNPETGDYAFPTLRSVSDGLGNAIRKTGGPFVLDKAFDWSSQLESFFVKRAIGAHAKAYANDLGHNIENSNALMRQLARDLVDDPNKVHELQARVLETVGDFTTRSPLERKVLRGFDPFWKWLKASTKFVLLTLPTKHPIKTALMLNFAAMTADERTKAGANQYWSDDEYDQLRSQLDLPARGEGFTSGALGGEQGIVPVTGLTSFGEVASNIAEPARLAGRPFSFATRGLQAAGAFNPAYRAAGIDTGKGGYYRTPGELAAKALPGGGEVADLKIPKSIDSGDRALQLGSEVALPGAKQLRRVLEGGTRPDLDSTVWDTGSAPVGANNEPRSLEQGISSVINPLHQQKPYPKPVKSVAQAAATSPGQMFKVRHENADGSYTVFWVRRTR